MAAGHPCTRQLATSSLKPVKCYSITTQASIFVMRQAIPSMQGYNWLSFEVEIDSTSYGDYLNMGQTLIHTTTIATRLSDIKKCPAGCKRSHDRWLVTVRKWM